MIKNRKTKTLVQFAMLLAIEMVVCFTVLGSIPIGPLVATLSHVPVIIAAVTLGTKCGALMGAFFGLFSFIYWSFMNPGPMAFVFTPFYNGGNFASLLICFVPRILIGVIAGLIYSSLSKRLEKKNYLAYIIAGAVGSAVNTLLVLGGIYVFFGPAYADVNGIAYELLLGVMGASILTNGIPEAVVGALLCVLVGKPVNKYINNKD